MTGTATDQTWAFALGRGKVGQENADRLTDELGAAVGADFLKWQKHEVRLHRRLRKIEEGVPQPCDFTSFIFDHLFPQSTDRKLSKGRVLNKEFLDLVKKLEPDQFVGLVLLYAHRIGDRDGVSRAYGILVAPSSGYRHHLKAYRDSHRGGGEKAAREKEKLAVRNQKILKRAKELLTNGKPKRNIASILAREFGLTATSIRNIGKNSKLW